VTVETAIIGVSGATISVLLAVVSFFLWRVFNQIDKLSDSHHEFAISLKAVVIEMKNIKENVEENKRKINGNLIQGEIRC